MAEDVQHTLSVTELLNEKIASGKEALREKEKVYYAKSTTESVSSISNFIVYIGIGVTYVLVGLFMILISLVILGLIVAGIIEVKWSIKKIKLFSGGASIIFSIAFFEASGIFL